LFVEFGFIKVLIHPKKKKKEEEMFLITALANSKEAMVQYLNGFYRGSSSL
jgi:hypothetical protein